MVFCLYALSVSKSLAQEQVAFTALSKWPYNTKQWKQLRKHKLNSDPICAYCDEIGIVTPATVVDHIQPVKLRPDLAFDPHNLASSCKHCHDSYKQRFEKSGYRAGHTADGTPTDPDHHWNV